MSTIQNEIEGIGKVILEASTLRAGPEGGELVLSQTAFQNVCIELARRPAVVSEGQAVAWWNTKYQSVMLMSRMSPELGGLVGIKSSPSYRAGELVPLYTAVRKVQCADEQDGWYNAANWLRNHYQDYPNVASLCEAIENAAPSAAPEAPTAAQAITNKEIELAMQLGTATGTLRFVATVCKDKAILGSVMRTLDELKAKGATAAQEPEVSYIDRRTEQIRLSHANADSKGKIQLRNEVECLLAHIALLKSERAAPVAEAKMLPCPDCGTDRLKDPCPRMADECAMVADAHLLAVPVAEAPTDPGWTAEEICNACVKSGLGILQCDTLMTLLNGNASPALLALLERVAAPTTEQAKAVRRATDAEVEEWVERHDIGARLKGIDARAAFEDAESLHMTFDAAAQASPAKPDLARLTEEKIIELARENFNGAYINLRNYNLVGFESLGLFKFVHAICAATSKE